jgi:pilus assembly protein TadC
MVTLIGILCGLLVFVLFSPRRVRKGEASQRLAEMYSLDAARNLADLNPSTLEYKLLAAAVPTNPVTFRLLTLAIAIAGAVITWAFIPGVPALMLGGIAGYFPYAWLDGKVKSRAREIDRHLPIAIGRIASGLLAGGAVADVLQRAGESLAIEGPNPLTPELLLTAAELRSKGRQQALHNLAVRSPSTSLANLAHLLESYSEAGGAMYAEVLTDITQRVQQILVARNRAVAKAGDALLSAKIIPIMLLIVFLFLSRDPLIRSALPRLP